MKTRRPQSPAVHCIIVVVCLVLCAVADSSCAAAQVQASRGTITLPTYPWWPAVPHPYFRGTDDKNIYPYPMLDNLSREKVDRTYQTVVLENEFLRITFLPALGGKIHEVLDKTTQQPMFYVNNVIKPGLIAMTGAWTSGGVEWNTGPEGHTVSAMQPVDVLILPPENDGSGAVVIGETERIYGTKWTVMVTLRPGRSFIEQRIRIYNPTETVRPYYFWNCTAVPNTPGFRFIYPMTLGCDHGAEKFFRWPIDHGKDLTRGTNYQDASSIFAWYCDQDFFGSYDDDANRGVVAYANHHQLPGKKAWTWGQGGFGKMHQMDLTDQDGPYNEVQTGPMLTQAQVGRLEPCEAVEWEEWWYPVHGLGGFTFANRDVVVNASLKPSQLDLRILGTGSWEPVNVRVRNPAGEVVAQTRCELSPRRPALLQLALPADTGKPEVELAFRDKALARFQVPLELPHRTPPGPKTKPETAAQLAHAGWDHYLFARFTQAEAQFQSALKQDSKCVAARTGLALLRLDSDPAAARAEARAALETNPDHGLASLALAAASLEQDESAALDHAWKASLDPLTAVAGRALAAKILLRQEKFEAAVAALSSAGPWQTDPLCRARRALAHLLLGQKETALELARANLETDPLDTFALSVFWLAQVQSESGRLEKLLAGNAPAVQELVSRYTELNQHQLALNILGKCYVRQVPLEARDPMLAYWAAFLAARVPGLENVELASGPSATPLVPAAFPYGAGSVPVLRQALAKNPHDGRAALFLGHILFHLGRHAEGRAHWQRAADLGFSRAVAHRALGMASLTLDQDAEAARTQLTKAHQADRSDAIVARDLARVLFTLAGKTDSTDRKKELWTQSRDTLLAAFSAGKNRSDFVCLLGRAHNRLGDYAATAQLLDSVRITVWEGSREAHDLFQEAHLALGREHLKAGRGSEALAEFNRALEYPENLATGRLENTKEGHIHKLRAEALTALGQTKAARQALENAELP